MTILLDWIVLVAFGSTFQQVQPGTRNTCVFKEYQVLVVFGSMLID